MAKYLVLIYGDEQQWAARTEADQRRTDEGHLGLRARAGARVLADGELAGDPATTTVRAGADGLPAITDGPFLETKEVLGGFYLLDADHLDEVISLVSGLAEVADGHSGVEIRPLVEHG
jgi:hypothetical protein